MSKEDEIIKRLIELKMLMYNIFEAQSPIEYLKHMNKKAKQMGLLETK